MARVLTPRRQHVSTVTVGNSYEFIAKNDGSGLWNYINDDGKCMRLSSNEMANDWQDFQSFVDDPAPSIQTERSVTMKLENFNFLDGVKVKDLTDDDLINRLRTAQARRDDLAELGLTENVLANRTRKTNEYIDFIVAELTARDSDA